MIIFFKKKKVMFIFFKLACFSSLSNHLLIPTPPFKFDVAFRDESSQDPPPSSVTYLLNDPSLKSAIVLSHIPLLIGLLSLSHSLIRSLTCSLTHSFTHSLTRSLTHSLTHSLTDSLFRHFLSLLRSFHVIR